jgi:hypothetical protein
MDPQKMEALGSMVDEVDANSPEAQAQRAAESAQAEAQQLRTVSEAEAWAAVPSMVGKLACMVAPELQAIYTAESCREWGESMVPVAQKYGWNGPGQLPELNLAIASAALAVPTWMVLRLKLAQLKAASKAAEAPAPAAAPAVAAPSPADASAVGGQVEGAAGGG